MEMNDTEMAELDRAAIRGLDVRQRAARVTVPACMTLAQFRDWQLHANSMAPPHPLDGVCQDCTPEHQAHHIAQRTCIWPDVRFFSRYDVQGRLASVDGIRISLRPPGKLNRGSCKTPHATTTTAAPMPQVSP